MEPKLLEEDNIRRYLLGKLGEPELSKIEQKLLDSEELSQTADLIEDEIIEQYLDGDLGEPDKKAVETHFLRPPAHRHKLHFARLLRHRFETEGAVEPARPVPIPQGKIQMARWLWSYGGAMAAVILLGWSVYLNQEIGASLKKQAALEGELTQERAHTATQTEKLQALQSPGGTLNLKPGITRGGGIVPRATIPSQADFIKVDLVLSYASSAPFRVRLVDATTGKEIWSETGLTPTAAPPLSRLAFYLPAQLIKSGSYNLVVTPASAPSSPSTYPFDTDASQ
jgi:hypothetical protein